MVTGGAGLIGSHLCERLLNDGNEVICIDNLLTGSLNNIRHLIKNKHFTFKKWDVTESYYFRVGQIYNLACPASPVYYRRYPLLTLRTNFVGVYNALELAKRVGARVLQASTSEIYGDSIYTPQKESYWGNVNPIGERACYDEGKRVAETLCKEYQTQEGVEVRIVRIFNTYGPRMHKHDGRIVSNFIIQALQNKPLTVYGDGSQTRSFQYVSDLIEGLVLMMNNSSGFSGPVNLGNPREITINEFLKMIKKLIPESRSRVVHKVLPSDDPKRRRPEITLAKEKLGWQPKISLEKGLLLTIDYFRSKLL